MALVYCPECGTKVSDKASLCPFCGYRSSRKNLPMAASKAPIATFRWGSTSLAERFDQVFPISTIQSNNLSIIFGKAENLSRVAPSFFEAVKAVLPETIKIADYSNPLCLIASKVKTATEAVTFKESIKPRIGIFIRLSALFIHLSVSPVASVPKINAIFPFKSVF